MSKFLGLGFLNEIYLKIPMNNHDFREMADIVRFRPRSATWDSPYTKTFLLLQAHFSRLSLPNSDYLTDTKSALDNATRVMQVSC